jgi:hypothetical protein
VGTEVSVETQCCAMRLDLLVQQWSKIIVGAHCCATKISDDSAIMAYVMWLEEHVWNDLIFSLVINALSVPILFADNTNVIILRPEIESFQNCMNDPLTNLSKWFKSNKHALNFDKTFFIKFANNKERCINVKKSVTIIKLLKK